MIKMDIGFLKDEFESGMDYETYLATDKEKGDKWLEFGKNVMLTAEQKQLLAGFTREMKVLVVSGIWCGDCVQQGPLMQAIADASDRIDLRWLDRDAHMQLAEKVIVNKGLRVPMVIFLAEDYELVSVYGDRVLARYRAMAEKKLGIACPLPGAKVSEDEMATTLQDWLDEFERVQLLLRLSTRLREKHGD